MGEATGRDRRALGSSLGIGVIFTALAMTFSWAGAFGIFGPMRAWYVPRDIWTTVQGGSFVWAGALGYVYQGAHSYSLPLSFVVMAPASGIVDHFGLLTGYPFPIPYPSGWLVVGPYSTLLGVLALHAVRRLAWEFGIRRRLWAVQVMTAVVVLAPCFEWGHPEDVLALAFSAYFAREVIRGDHIRAALYLSVAISFKQWAVILVPLAIGCAPSGRRMRVLAASTLLPAVFTLFVLGVDFPDASRALFSPVTSVKGTQGHVALFGAFLGHHTSLVTRIVAVVVAVAVGWGLRHVRSAPGLLGGMAVVLAVRALAEPVTFTYYWSPALLMAGLAFSASVRRFTVRHWIAPVTAVAWAVPWADPRTERLWWVGEAVLLCAIAGSWIVRSFRQFGLVRECVKVGDSRPIVNAMSTPTGLGDTSWTP